MNRVLIALVSAAAGAAVGYFVARWQFNKKLAEEVEAIKKTHEDLCKRKEIPPEEDGAGVVDVTKEAEEESEDEDYGDFEGDEREEELLDARKQFMKELHDTYADTGKPYNITEEEYATPNWDYEKDVLMIDEATDRAYLEDGSELDDWHDAIGDLDLGTLDDDKRDEYGHIYVRSPREGKDFQITWSNIELAH
jgi:hypothetical protein